MVKFRILISACILLLTSAAYGNEWSGLSAGKLLAISEQGERGFQIAMLYVLGLADGVESQRLMLRGEPCRRPGDMTNHEIASLVIRRMDMLGTPEAPAGKVALNAYLSEFCEEVTIEGEAGEGEWGSYG